MARVDFYLLSEPNPPARWLYACRLCEKAYQKNHKIYILVSSTQESQALDDLLWTFQADSFLPHEIDQRDVPGSAPVQIGTSSPTNSQDILINLTTTIPTFATQFQRIIEIVTADETERSIARQNFRIYRSQGYQIESHSIEIKK